MPVSGLQGQRVRIRPPGCTDEKQYGWRVRDGPQPSPKSDAPGAAAAAAAPPAVEKRPDFTGTWLCVELEGDWAAMLSAMGTGFIVRKAAAALGYGKGKQRQVISWEGSEKLTVEDTTQKTITNTYTVGGPFQEAKAADGSVSQVKTLWEDDVLVNIVKASGARKEMKNRRFMRDDRMIYEMNHDGTTVGKIFEKQE
eukprot:Hpha_TRINITY_DN15282_c4_g19::TRINITY_DN15282_c4_g19_i1::g.66744::m.66744